MKDRQRAVGRFQTPMRWVVLENIIYVDWRPRMARDVRELDKRRDAMVRKLRRAGRNAAKAARKR